MIKPVLILKLSICLLFFSVNSHAQNDTVYLKKDNLKAIGKYKQDKKDSLWTYLYPDNKIQSQGYYKNGALDGKWTNWYPNGVKQSEDSYENNVKEGVWKEWDAQGRIMNTVTWHNGKRDGIAEEYDYDLMEVKTLTIQDDSFNGTVFWTTLDGKKELVGEYTLGLKTGLWTTYFPDGNIESKVTYKNDEEEGEHVWYDEQGKIIKTVKYKSGVEIRDKR